MSELKLTKKICLDWDNIDEIIKSSINCTHIEIHEAEKVDDKILIYFDILEPSKREDIKECFKLFCNNIDVNKVELFNEIDDSCDHILLCGDSYDILIDEEISLKILEEYFKEIYDKSLEIEDIKPYSMYVEILFK